MISFIGEIKKKKNKLIETENRLAVVRYGSWGLGELDKGGVNFFFLIQVWKFRLSSAYNEVFEFF